jgi:hypothetical protein
LVGDDVSGDLQGGYGAGFFGDAGVGTAAGGTP